MKFSYRWLKQLSGTEKSPEELAAFLTMRAFEVEEILPTGLTLPQVIVGKVISLERHPGADRLQVARVQCGSHGERTIVCGAPNIALSNIVAVALPGAMLPGDVLIRAAEIRGVRSEGMICSEKELGIGENHEGILILPEDATLGVPLSEFWDASDWVLDVKILPDRAHDCLSHVGLAREIAALEERVFDYDYEGLTLPHTDRALPFRISLQAEKKCCRYIGALVSGVTMGPSPRWLVERLSVFGMRSRNCIVDLTNLVMLELGAPLHAFDWEKIAGESKKTIGPRFARNGERATLLDGKTYEFNESDIVIADSNGVLALAGILGGKESAVSDETKNVFFEAASFDAVSIRRTRTRLGIETDASMRFEKDLSPDLPERALTRLLELVKHLAGGEVQGVIDERGRIPSPRVIECSADRVTTLLGADISVRHMKKILELRGCLVVEKKNVLAVTPPPFRLDLRTIADITEEIGRGIGYEHILPVAPEFSLGASSTDPLRALERSLRDGSVAQGLTEIYAYSFYGEKEARLARLLVERHFELQNPMNPEQALVRISLLPGLLDRLALNVRRFPEAALFEVAKAYEKVTNEVREHRFFSGVIGDQPSSDGAAFFEFSARLSRILNTLGIFHTLSPGNFDGTLWHPSRSAILLDRHGNVLGTVGEIHPNVSLAFRIPRRGVAFECDIHALLAARVEKKIFTPFRRLPETLRDVSFFVPRETRASDVKRVIFEAGNRLVTSVDLFDRYQNERGEKSFAVHIRFGKAEEMVSGEEADRTVDHIGKALESKLGASIRKDETGMSPGESL